MIVVANNASTLIIDLFPDQGSSVAAAVSLESSCIEENKLLSTLTA